MSVYTLLLNLHLLIAVASGFGFGVRGYVRVIARKPLLHPMVRVGPHVVDTLLVASGVALWVLTGLTLWSWLGIKLVLLIAYLVLGISAFRSTERATALVLYLAALLSYIGIILLSVIKPVA
ncbi:MAG: SirB2 family protein [Wenzhouxiangella sp.]